MPPLNRTDGGDKNTNTARNPSTEGFGIAVPDPSFIFPIHESSLPLKQRNRSRFGRKQGRCVGQAASRIFASSIERPLLLLRVCPKCTSLPTSLQSLSLHFREAEQKLAPDRIEDRREKNSSGLSVSGTNLDGTDWRFVIQCDFVDVVEGGGEGHYFCPTEANVTFFRRSEDR